MWMTPVGAGGSEGRFVGAGARGTPRVALPTGRAALAALGRAAPAALLAATLGDGLRSGRRPGVDVAAAAGRALAALGAAGVAPAAARPGRAGDLGGGVLQARADFLDLDLEDRALLALTGLVRSGLEPALDDNPHAALQRLRDVLRGLPPDRAGEEQRVAVLPLVGLPVERARRRRDPEVGHGRTRGGEAQLRVVDEVANHRDDGLACHVRTP